MDEGRPRGALFAEEWWFMVHISCDLCGKRLQSSEGHHVVKIEVFTAHDPTELIEADLDADHMDEVSQFLDELEDEDEADDLEPLSQQFRYDLCPDCRKRFVRDPLSREASQKLHFSEN